MHNVHKKAVLFPNNFLKGPPPKTANNKIGIKEKNLNDTKLSENK